MAASIDELYGDIWGQARPGFQEELERSLDPREPNCLYDLFAAGGVGPDWLVLDVGSRDAGHAIELSRRFGCRCVAVDPIPLHQTYMSKAIAAAGAEEQVTFLQAPIEALPVETNSVDAIWCRDMLNHVDLPRAFAECARVLKPGAPMFIYVTLATEAMEPREAARLYASMAIVPENMDRDAFEACARRAGFEIAATDPIDSQWRERSIEDGSGEYARTLLRLARMRRREEELVARYGRAYYEATRGSEIWGIYQLLGKLCPTVFWLQKPGEGM